MNGKKLALYVAIGTLVLALLIYLGFQWYFTVNPVQ